ncbi:MFS transporter [Pseudogracilibacillus sp. SO30301A]|uniref:MFS transporter n=1 Tax=Pseudogracilibacillus sp. SO30301A TaxID=3098291 RepID=UPI00300E6AD0
MKNLVYTMQKYPSARAFLIFSVLFYLSMAVSKTVHALWFDEQNALTFYGFSYTMMAIAGALSFITGKIGDIISPSFALRLGVFVYAIGLFLRIFTNSLIIAGISGFIAGLGASLVIVSMRYWILSIGDEENRAAIVSLKETGSNTGTAVGASIAGILTLLLSYIFKNPIVTVLIISSVLCLVTILFVPKLNKDKKNSDKDKKNSDKDKEKLKKSVPKQLITGVIFFGVITGLSVSLFTPFFPVILKEQGVPVTLIGLYIALIGISSIIFAPLFGNKEVDKRKSKLFFWFELLVGILTLLFMFKLHYLIVPFIIVIRTLFLTGSVISQELMELNMYPKYAIGMLFGLSQSSFFVGDAIGGSIGGILFSINLNYSLVVCSLLILFNACIFPLFYKFILRKPESGEIHEVL